MKIKKSKLTKILSILGVLVIFLISVLVFVKTTARADSTLGFDEGYGSTIHDTNNNVSGTITGATWQQESTCAKSKCLYFDGDQDYVDFGDDADLDFAQTDAFTISLWFRHSQITSGTQVLIAKANASAGYKIYMASDGDIVFGIDDDGTWDPDASVTSTAATYDDNAWHHLEAVKNGTTGIYLYIDGINVGSNLSVSGVGTLVNSATFYIGIDGDETSNDYTGFIDEVKVYRSARTAAEAKSDFAGTDTTRGTSVSFGPNDSWLTNGLVGYWKMDEAGDTNRVDSSGNGNTLTESASDTIVQAAGKYGNSGDFERGDTEYLTITDGSQKGLDLTQTLTLSAWINAESAANYAGIISKGTGGLSNFSYALVTTLDQRLGLMIDDDGTGSPTQILSDANVFSIGTWSHFVVTHDGSIIRLFKNGVEQTSGDFPYSTNSSIYNSTADFFVGYSEYGPEYYDGLLDEVRVYNRALTPSEVEGLYRWAPGPVGEWKFDENTGTSAYDSSGNDYTARLGGPSHTANKTPTWTTGKFGSALYFDGISTQEDYVDLTPSANTLLDGTSAFTISAWVKYTTLNDYSVIFYKQLDSTHYLGFMSSGSYGSDNNDLELCVSNGTDTCIDTTGNILQAGQWYFVAATFSSGTAKIYLNGVSQTTTGSVASTVASINQPIDIGAYGAYATIGAIDNLSVYNYARTPAQIIEDMNGGHPAPGSPVGSAVAHWEFDEGYSTTAHDTSPNTNDLTLNSASWTTSGKFASAWNGTGGNIRLSRATDADLEFSATDSFTLSTWFKSDAAGNPAAAEYLVADGGPAGSAGYSVYSTTNGYLCFGIDDDASWGPDVSSCTTASYYDAAWHHLVAVRDVIADSLYLYIDGVLKDSDNDTTSATLDSSPTFYIGDMDADDAGSGEEFAGNIDDTQIFRSALTTDQVKELYNQGAASAMGGRSSSANEYCIPGDGSTCSSPVGEWKFDEKTGGNANDTSGNNSTGTITAAPWTIGQTGSGLKMSSNSLREYVTVTDPSSGDLDFTGSDNFTLNFWAKQTSVSESPYVISKVVNYSETNPGYWFGFSYSGGSNEPYCQIYDGGAGGNDAVHTSTVASTVVDGNWHFYTCVLDRTGSAMGTAGLYLYVDGKQIGTPDTSLSETGSLANAENLNIGEISTAFELAGSLDGVHIYKYARTPAQIAWDYNRGSPIAQYDFDECSLAVLHDVAPKSDRSITPLNGTITEPGSGSNNAGVGSCGVSAATMWNGGATGKYSSSLEFDGTDDHVTVADPGTNSILDFVNGQGITLSAWINPTTLPTNGNYRTLITKGAVDGNPDATYMFQIGRVSNKNIISFCFESNGGAVIDECFESSRSVLSTSAWQHIAFTYTYGTGSSAKPYYNGVRQPGSWVAGDGDVAPTVTNKALWLGADQYTGAAPGQVFNGQIDDVRIYNYVLTPTQIKNLYNNSSAVKF